MAEQESKVGKSQKLTPEQQKKLAAWIAGHSKTGCPVCGHPTWDAGQEFVEIRPFYQTSFLGGHVYPAVLLICQNCAYMMLFHAIRTGVMDKVAPEPKKDGN